MDKKDERVYRFHRVTFLRGGKPTSIIFPAAFLASNFLKTLHSSRHGKMESVPELEGTIVLSSDPKMPAGTIVKCPRGPRYRTWKPRKPRIMRKFVNYTLSVLALPNVAAGFANSFPEEAPTTENVVARHLSPEAGQAWAIKRFGKQGDGEWWPKKK